MPTRSASGRCSPLRVVCAAAALLAVTTTCGGDDGGEPDVRIWAPAYLGMGALWGIDLEERMTAAGIRAALVEEELAYQDVEPTLRAAIMGGSLEAELVAVPWAIGQRLLADGLLEEPYAQLFSSDDPDEAAALFGIIVAPPASAGSARAGRSSDATATGLEFVNGCLTPASKALVLRSRAVEAPSGGRAVMAPGSRPIFDLGDWSLIDGTLNASGTETVKLAQDKVEEMTIEAVTEKTTLEIIDRWAKKGGSYIGLSKHVSARGLAIKILGKAFGAISALMDYKSFLELLYNSVDTNDSTKDAYESAVETYASASGQIVDARSELFQIELGVIDCSLSGADALARLDELGELVTTYENIGRTALAEMANIHGELGPHAAEALDNSTTRFLTKWSEVRAAAQAKADSIKDLETTGTALLADDPNVSDDGWRAFAELLTGLDADNPFTHSNGVLMTTSDGVTDLVQVGGAKLDLSAEAAAYLFGPGGTFACGTGAIGTTLCGTDDIVAGPAFVAMTNFSDGALVDLTTDAQFGLVWDADGSEGNNYQAPASYPQDLFDDSDRWYEVLHDPDTGWALQATLARDGSFSSQVTAARAILNGTSLVFVIPAAELESGTPSFRVTAFRHNGDYGLNPPHDFNGDVYPLVGMPLASPSTNVFPARAAP